MLTKELDRETEQLLAEILEQEQVTSDELIRTLIRDRWLSLRNPAIELPIRTADSFYPSGYPGANHTEPTLPPVTSNTPPRQTSKQAIAEFLKRKRFH
jgi:hypothetical protein